MPASLTAKYIAAAAVNILTQPDGLKIKVDGQYNALNPYYFAWGIGETHHLEAAAQQTDAQGRLWQFSSGSNGGAATADVHVAPGAGRNGLRFPAAYNPFNKVHGNNSLSRFSVILCTAPR